MTIHTLVRQLRTSQVPFSESVVSVRNDTLEIIRKSQDTICKFIDSIPTTKSEEEDRLIKNKIVDMRVFLNEKKEQFRLLHQYDELEKEYDFQIDNAGQIDENLCKEKLRVSVNRKVIGKVEKGSFHILTNGYEQVQITAKELWTEIYQGHAFSCSWFNGSRADKNFLCSELVAIDVDEGMRIEEVIENEEIRKNALFLYTTSSHTEEKHRFRIVFRLPHLVTNATEYKTIVTSFTNYFEKSDKSCKDACRAFYGSVNCKITVFGGRISQDFLNQVKTYIKSPISTPVQKQKRPSIYLSGNAREYVKNYETARQILSSLPYLPYNEWFKVLCALKNTFTHEDALILCSERWVGDDFKEIPYKLDTITSNDISFGTLIHISQQYGWSPLKTDKYNPS